jgi:dTDP-4-dehydrorhamnose reductase
MRVLILGVTGMLGSAVYKVLASDAQHEAWGTLRGADARRFFAEGDRARLIDGVDVTDPNALVAVMNRVRPDVVINCVGLIKQLAVAADPLLALPINAMLPHELAGLCRLIDARLIHFSTDCVFSGRAGGYRESDPSDAEDLYGKSKFIGEVHDDPGVVTLRTSIIGHELNSHHSLLEWFLAQQGRVKGYSKAVFSGLPSVELGRVMKDFILPLPQLHGVYHISAAPISKLDLLRLIATIYGKEIDIVPDDSVVIDRSLNSERFTRMAGYVAPSWQELVTAMHRAR